MTCEICGGINLTHTALQAEASPLREDGGCAGPPPAGRVPICEDCTATFADQLPSLQADGPGDAGTAAGP